MTNCSAVYLSYVHFPGCACGRVRVPQTSSDLHGAQLLDRLRANRRKRTTDVPNHMPQSAFRRFRTFLRSLMHPADFEGPNSLLALGWRLILESDSELKKFIGRTAMPPADSTLFQAV